MYINILKSLLILLFITIYTDLTAQKEIQAIKLQGVISLDGILDESDWDGAVATDFIQFEPNTWEQPSAQSKVAIRYDDMAIYVGAWLIDDNPESILRELSIRDGNSNADQFAVGFDTYNDGINAFVFSVSAAGVQGEGRFSSQGEDSSWDAVWESKVTTDDKGWYVEMRIPYNAIRFTTVPPIIWGVQFYREIRRFREESFWNPVDPNKDGFVNQFGKLVGIKDIKPPFRLQLSPYASTYYNFIANPGQGQSVEGEAAYAFGADLKLGLGDAFTLDMTLVPDFGQTISDNNVLNLSPFEVFFDENRPFFTEGLELFNKGRLFYTRRIGGLPINYFNAYQGLTTEETVVSNPNITRLINASKISGRTSSGTGIGFFNGITAQENAIIESTDGSVRKVETSPLTNYNVVVLDQNLKNNSFVSLTNTHVLRQGSTYDAHVMGLFTSFNDKDQKYGFRGEATMSNRYTEDESDRGYMCKIEGGKYSGLWTYNLTAGLETDNYNPNDLGFLFAPNSTFYSGSLSYNEYTPKNKKLNLYRYSMDASFQTLYNPFAYNNFEVYANSFWLYQSRDAFGINTGLQPFEAHDYFEPRTPDFSSYLPIPRSVNIGGFYSSDYRRVFALDINSNVNKYDEKSRYNFNVGVRPRIRFSDKFSLFWSTSYNHLLGDQGYVSMNIANGKISGVADGDVLIGSRTRGIIENTLRSQYIFNANMGINLRIRHYLDDVEYGKFFGLGTGGKQYPVQYLIELEEEGTVYDTKASFFNVDLQYQWRFAPGSDLFIVWKNSIFYRGNTTSETYFQSLNRVLGESQNNSISLRAVYFLDYNRIFG